MSDESALDAKALSERLRALRGWTRSGDAITRTYSFADFKTAMIFVNGVAALAECAEHHPDITVSYKVVTLALRTHSAGGITGKDFDLARRIDETFPAPVG